MLLAAWSSLSIKWHLRSCTNITIKGVSGKLVWKQHKATTGVYDFQMYLCVVWLHLIFIHLLDYFVNSTKEDVEIVSESVVWGGGGQTNSPIVECLNSSGVYRFQME